MKKSYSYKECYRILDLNSNCSWAELRKSYKKSIQKWHPDRFKEGSKDKAGADNKIKTINIAYNQIYKYYRSHGALPPVEQKPKPKHKFKSGASSSDSSIKTQKANSKKIQPTDELNVTKKQVNLEYEKSSYHSLVSGFLIVILLGVLYYFYVDDFYLDESDSMQIKVNNNRPATKPFANSKNKARVETPVSKNYLEDKLTQKNLKESTALKINPIHEKLLPVEDTFFTSGSSISDVIGIQGAPTRTDGDIWFYGESEVHFSEGEVTHWVRKAKSPLKAKLKFKELETLKVNASGKEDL